MNDLEFDEELCPNCSSRCSMSFYQADIFIPIKNIAIEIKGKAHDSDRQQQKDLSKEQYLKEQFGVETISSRLEWFLNSKHEPRYEWIQMYADSIVRMLHRK